MLRGIPGRRRLGRLLGIEALDVLQVLWGHLLLRDLDDDAIDLVKTDFAVVNAEEFGLHFELAGTVVPDACVGGFFNARKKRCRKRGRGQSDTRPRSLKR